MGHFFGKTVGARSFDEKMVQKGAHLGHFFSTKNEKSRLRRLESVFGTQQ